MDSFPAIFRKVGKPTRVRLRGIHIVAKLRKVDIELALLIAPAVDVSQQIAITFSKLKDAETVKRGTATRQENTPIRSPWLRVLAECVTERVANTPADSIVATVEPLLEALCTLETRLPSLLHCQPAQVQPRWLRPA